MLPRVTCFPPKSAFTATSGLKLGMRSGTSLADVKAALAAARVEGPAMEHAVARSASEPSGRAAAVADATRARREKNCCMLARLLLKWGKKLFGSRLRKRETGRADGVLVGLPQVTSCCSEMPSRSMVLLFPSPHDGCQASVVAGDAVVHDMT